MPIGDNISVHRQVSEMGLHGYGPSNRGFDVILAKAYGYGPEGDLEKNYHNFNLVLLELAALQNPLIICNLGAGEGQESRDLATYHLQHMKLGYDLTSVSLADMRLKDAILQDNCLGINYQIAEAQTYLASHQNEHFALIVMQNFLHCVYDPLSMLQLAYDKIIAGGLIVFNLRELESRFDGLQDWQALVDLVNHQAASQIFTSYIYDAADLDSGKVAYGVIKAPRQKVAIDLNSLFWAEEVQVARQLHQRTVVNFPILHYTSNLL